MTADELRQLLLDYYGSALSQYPAAAAALAQIETASVDELIEMAVRLHLIE